MTSLPWYRDPRHRARLDGAARAAGDHSVGLDHPRASVPRRRQDATCRAAPLGFLGFTALAGLEALRIGRPLSRVDAVIAMSPPLTLGLTGWLVEPAASGAAGLQHPRRLPGRRGRDRSDHQPPGHRRGAAGSSASSYRRADAVTVLSDDLADNVRGKLPASSGGRRPRHPQLRRHRRDRPRRPDDRLSGASSGIGDDPVVLYAGNVGFSQSLDLMLAAARATPRGDVPDQRRWRRATGARTCRRRAGQRPVRRLHRAVATRRGAGDRRHPRRPAAARPRRASACRRRRTRSWPPARPVLASIDPDTEVPTILAESGGGVAVPPDDTGRLRPGAARAARRPWRGRGDGRAGAARGSSGRPRRRLSATHTTSSSSCARPR